MSITSSLVLKVAESTNKTPSQVESYASVSIDTRTLQSGALYVPIVGERFDGHQFIESAIEKGAKAALWQEGHSIPTPLPDHFQLYFVKDTLIALQQLAREYRDQVQPTVIAVTGSNGKTTVKDMLDSILTLAGTTYKTQGNFNNHIGLPLTILGMPNQCRYLILEMGMSGYGEIEFLSELAKPDMALITNIGESHMEQLGSRAGIAKAKSEIKAGLRKGGVLYIDGDEPLLSSLIGEDVHTVGFTQTSQVHISEHSSDAKGVHFTLNGKHIFTLPLLGKHNVKNAALAASLALGIGLDIALIQKGLSQVTISKMRLERSIGSSGELIINDAYNASPTSMKAALVTLKELTGFKQYIAVLGDMYELGSEEQELHSKIAAEVQAPITHLICVGNKAKWIYDAANIKTLNRDIDLHWAATVSEAKVVLGSLITSDSVVLLKASRGLQLEKILDQSPESEKGEMNK